MDSTSQRWTSEDDFNNLHFLYSSKNNEIIYRLIAEKLIDNKKGFRISFEIYSNNNLQLTILQHHSKTAKQMLEPCIIHHICKQIYKYINCVLFVKSIVINTLMLEHQDDSTWLEDNENLVFSILIANIKNIKKPK